MGRRIPHAQGLENGHQSVQITDNGIGIAPAEIEQVFERYYRGSGAERQHSAGSGFGLPIAKAIIVAHGGEISLDSTPGCGTRATIVLPVSHRLQAVG